MKYLIILLSLIALSACDDTGSSDSPSAGPAVKSPALVIAPTDPNSTWTMPTTVAAAEADLVGMYRLQTDAEQYISITGQMQVEGFIKTGYMRTVIAGHPAVQTAATCSFRSSQMTAEVRADGSFNIWQTVDSYTLSAGDYTSIQDCQLPSAQTPGAQTAMIVSFIDEKCVNVKLMRDTTQGRIFCKE